MNRVLYHIILLLIITFVAKSLLAQKSTFSSLPSQLWIEEHKDSLRELLLVNKNVPPEYEIPILAALMYYPDLEKVNIHFKKRAITTTMAAFPTIGSVFRKKSNRQYTIYINHKANKRKAPLIRNIPFEAKVGVIGHELGHIVDYQSKNIITIIANGIAYPISRKFRRNLEYKVDTITVKSGLGYGLYSFRLFIETEADLSDRYKRFKENIYMSSEEIVQLIDYLNDLDTENNIQPLRH
jgi:hypothetical protein